MNTKCSHGHSAPIALLKELPITQAGVARHKCAVCAYENGYLDGFKAALSALKEGLPESDEDILSLKKQNNIKVIKKIATSIKKNITHS